MQNWTQTLLSQYANSPTICALIESMNDAIDPSADIEAFLNNVWNINTAEGFGLDIWGRIVGVGRSLRVANNYDSFGFDDGLTDYAPFGQAPFFNWDYSSSVYTLDDATYQTVILIKALANITSTTVPNINALVTKLFANRGSCYVRDLGNMKMEYVFDFQLTAVESAVITQTDILPHPAGVKVSYLQLVSGQYFGFSEAGASAQPFNQGVFYTPIPITS